MNLSANFTLAEFLKSQTAERKDIDNTPDEDQIAAMRRLTEAILQPLREHYGKLVAISSGYRCEALCTEIGSSTSSQHTKGQAVDFEVFGVPNPELAKYIRDSGLSYDQLILEFHDPAKGPSSGWVHCSFVSEAENRNEALTIDSDGARQGIA